MRWPLPVRTFWLFELPGTADRTILRILAATRENISFAPLANDNAYL